MGDPTALVWYAVICGMLAAVAPNLGNRTIRIGIGAFVGILAALVLPIFKNLVG